MANTLSVMTNVIRTVVSKQRIRHKEKGFNLDLAYICDNIIAMGYPADKIESIYRNRLEDVYKFLEKNHEGHYKIYNLCIERSYDVNKFHGRVALYPFEDHNPPTIELISKFCEDVDSWLKVDSLNVAAIHCKAGKGRTGTMICCYLLYSGLHSTAEDALAWYAEKRTKDQKGVTIPSQRRYVEYFSYLMQNKHIPYKRRNLQFCEIRFIEANLLNSQGTVNCSISVPEDSQCAVDLQELQNLLIDFRKGSALDIKKFALLVAGDVKVEISHKTSRKKFFHFWFNTYFVQNVSVPKEKEDEKYVYTLTKSEIDDAHKDKDNKCYSENFKVELVFYSGSSGRNNHTSHQISNQNRDSQSAHFIQKNYTLTQQNISSSVSDLHYNCDQKSFPYVSTLGKAVKCNKLNCSDVKEQCQLAGKTHKNKATLQKQQSPSSSSSRGDNEMNVGFAAESLPSPLVYTYFGKVRETNEEKNCSKSNKSVQHTKQNVINYNIPTSPKYLAYSKNKWQNDQQQQEPSVSDLMFNSASNSKNTNNTNSNVVQISPQASKSSSISSHSSSATGETEEDWESGESPENPPTHNALLLSQLFSSPPTSHLSTIPASDLHKHFKLNLCSSYNKSNSYCKDKICNDDEEKKENNTFDRDRSGASAKSKVNTEFFAISRDDIVVVKENIKAEDLYKPALFTAPVPIRHRFLSSFSLAAKSGNTTDKPFSRKKPIISHAVEDGASGTQCSDINSTQPYINIGDYAASKQKFKVKLKKKKLKFSQKFQSFQSYFHSNSKDFCENYVEHAMPKRRNSTCNMASFRNKTSISILPSSARPKASYNDEQLDLQKEFISIKNGSLLDENCTDYYSSMCDKQLSFNNSPCKSPRSIVDFTANDSFNSSSRCSNFSQDRNAQCDKSTEYMLSNKVVVVAANPAKVNAIGFNVDRNVAVSVDNNCMEYNGSAADCDNLTTVESTSSGQRISQSTQP